MNRDLNELRILQKSKKYKYFDSNIEQQCNSVYWQSNWPQSVSIQYRDLYGIVNRFYQILSGWDKISIDKNNRKYMYIPLRILNNIKVEIRKKNTIDINLQSTNKFYHDINNAGCNKIPILYQLINSYVHILKNKNININTNIAYEYAQCLLSKLYLWSICNKSPKQLNKIIIPWEDPKRIINPDTISNSQTISNSNTNSCSESTSKSISITPNKRRRSQYDPTLAQTGKQILSDMQNGNIPLDQYPPHYLIKYGIFDAVKELKLQHARKPKQPTKPKPVTQSRPCQAQQNNEEDTQIDEPTNAAIDSFSFLIEIYLAETNQTAINESELNVLMLFYEEYDGNIAEIMMKMYQQLSHKFHRLD